MSEEWAQFGKTDSAVLDDALRRQRQDRMDRATFLGEHICAAGKTWRVYLVSPGREGECSAYDFLQADQSGQQSATIEDWQMTRDFADDWRKACNKISRQVYGGERTRYGRNKKKKP